MAHRHGLAGKYGKSVAFKRGRRIVGLLMIIGCFGFAGAGFLSGFFWRSYGPIAGGLAMLAALVLFFAIVQRLDPYMNRVGIDRIKHLRGAQAEALIAWMLEDLDDGWHIFNGMKLWKNGDIDHVVVGPAGMFCISTKSKRGLFSGTALGVLHNSRPCDFAKDAMNQTMSLRDRLKTHLGEDTPWIQAVLALPFGWVDNDAFDGHVWLVHADDLARRIAPEKPEKKLTTALVGRIVEILERLKADGEKQFGP